MAGAFCRLVVRGVDQHEMRRSGGPSSGPEPVTRPDVLRVQSAASPPARGCARRAGAGLEPEDA